MKEKTKAIIIIVCIPIIFISLFVAGYFMPR